MTVSGTKREKGHLVRVSFPDRPDILLDLDFCIGKCIREGDEISEEDIKEYISESDYVRAKSRAIWLLDRYTYTERRLFEKLAGAGFSRPTCARVLSRLKELGLIDDKSLALRYAEDCAFRGISKREAYAKLMSKGFSAGIIKEALDNTEFDENAQLDSLIARKYAAKLAAGQTDKVYAALVRKGFSYRAVREALKKYSQELEYSEDL